MTVRSLVLAAALAAPAAMPASLAAQRFALEGVIALEGWKTDSGSQLLARNGGAFAPQATGYAWLSVRPAARLELFALGEANVGSADEESGVQGELQLLEARLALAPWLQLAAGRILMPMGLFGARRFPHVNPVIGAPDLYPPLYPYGAMLSGTAAQFDWRVGAVSLPNVNTSYTPEPAHRLRPVVGGGVRLGPALHVGASFTQGPYLSEDVNAALPAGAAWYDYDQRILAFDARFSAGYVETRAEVAFSRYEVPTVAAPQTGSGFYVESRVTLSPRVFVGARLEWFDYPFVRAFGTNWVARTTLQQNGELGVGYRFSAAALLKLSARRDNWPGPDPSPNFRAPNGYAVAGQFSWVFSAASLLGPRY
jgi:hypothetical protein